MTCRRTTVKPHNQLMSQLPVERVTPCIVFQQVGIDYAGPVRLRVGHVRRPTYVKAYIGVFVSFTIKAVHLELISDLTSTSFVACLRRFIAHRGKPHTIWSDHGSNFVGARPSRSPLCPGCPFVLVTHPSLSLFRPGCPSVLFNQNGTHQQGQGISWRGSGRSR